MTSTIFAANWKMHLGPGETRAFLDAFLSGYDARPDREVWFFPPAVSLETAAQRVSDRPDIRVGAQNVHWEREGAYTGESSVGMVHDAGSRVVLVGHSERRHVFGETDEETAKKVRAVMAAGMVPVLCVGEKLGEREADRTIEVVHRQLGALADIDGHALDGIVIAYEPVWAIGTGATATPGDAATVHAAIRSWLTAHGATAAAVRVLYGGSVKPGNAEELLAEQEIDGVLVGGASVHPDSWAQICTVPVD